MILTLTDFDANSKVAIDKGSGREVLVMVERLAPPKYDFYML